MWVCMCGGEGKKWDGKRGGEEGLGVYGEIKFVEKRKRNFTFWLSSVMHLWSCLLSFITCQQ